MTLAAAVQPLSQDDERDSALGLPGLCRCPLGRAVGAMSAVGDARLMLSIPTRALRRLHLTVEDALQALPGVHSARVNLTIEACSSMPTPT